MSGALNSVLGNNDILGAALGVASMCFPPLGIAMAASNVVQQVVGQAVNQAAQQLSQQAGMPKFLTEMIGDLVKNVLKDLQKPSDKRLRRSRAGPSAAEALKGLLDGLTKSIVDGAKSIMEQGGDEKCEGGGKGGKGGKKSAGNWLIAMANAMGNAAGEHVGRMVKLSKEIESLTAQGGSDQEQADAAKQVSAKQAEFQAESQMFGMLQASFSNAIKSIGEGMSQMARKG